MKILRYIVRGVYFFLIREKLIFYFIFFRRTNEVGIIFYSVYFWKFRII